MAKQGFWGAGLFVLIFTAGVAFIPAHDSTPPIVSAASAASAACTPPTQVSSTNEETAWRLFVAATCPVNASAYPFVTWETWIEQTQLYPQPQLLRKHGSRFHLSPLAAVIKKVGKHPKGATKRTLLQVSNQDCNTQTWSKRTICEEVRINPDATTYIRSNGLTTLKGQVQFAFTKNQTYDFPKPSVEVKADWILLPSCSSPPVGVHVEQVSGSCYALGGIHLISKLIDKWIWATFEPQNMTTNSQRCVVLGCNDPWGSNPAKSSGKPTVQTTALANLMTAANLAPEWGNYRLDGVQVDYLDSNGNPTRLGNSIIEGDNAGSPTLMKTASCISCHARATINNQAQSYQPPSFVLGTPAPLPAGYVTQDFVWSLSTAH